MSSFRFIFLAVSLFIAGFTFSQNNTCANATPFCTGQTMNFPAGTNSPNNTPLGCLGTQPNPAWFFMQIATGGSVSISMAAVNDIDFICWGPFPTLGGACSSLAPGNVQSCSYSGSPTETCTISNAVAGQFYMLLITNFSNSVQNITFNQNNAGTPGAGSTNCGFVCVVSGTTTGAICAGQNATVSMGPGTSTSVISYTWTAPNSFTSTSYSNVFTNIQNTTTYTVAGTNSAVINGGIYTGTCQAVVTVSVVQYPSFNIVPASTTICQGGNFFANVTFVPASNPANYSFNWQPFTGAGVWQPTSPTTLIAPLLLPQGTPSATVIYSVTVAPSTTLASCPTTKTLAVTINNPLTPTITAPPPLCDTFGPAQLIAAPTGGTWSGNPALTAGGLFTPASATIGINSVTYGVTVGTGPTACVVKNTHTVSVSKFYSAALTSSLTLVCEQDPLINLMNIVQNTLTGVWTGTQVSANQFNPSGLSSGTYNLTYSTTSLPNPATCPHSTILSVPVFNPPTPTINPIAPRCNNGGTVALTAIPPNGVWSGATGVSPSGIQTTSANAIGNSTVIYTNGQGTCVASSSKAFHVSQFISAALTGTINHLCATANPINLLGITQNPTGLWSGIGVVNSSSFSPANLSTNNYNLVYNTVSTPDVGICPDSSKIAVFVLNPPTPNITNVGPVCTAQGPIQLTVTPTTGYWVPSSYLSASGVYSPGISPVGNNAVQYVIGTNTCNSQQTKIISTEAFVSAEITSAIKDLCTTGSQVNLLPITISGTGNWSGPGISGTSFNPAVSGAGNFTLTYNTSSIPSGLCPDKATIAVKVFSLAIPSITKAGPFCTNSMPVQLQVSPVGGIFGSGVVGAVSNGGVFNPAFGLVGDNVISYSISSGPCVANALAHVTVEKFISADFGKYGSSAYCVNNLPFSLNSLVLNPGGDWDQVQGVNGSMFNPGVAIIGDNLITYHTKTPLYPSLCPDTKTITLKVKEIPVVTAKSSTYSGCAPVEVVLSSDVTGNGYGSWFLGDGSEKKTGFGAVHVFNSPGSFSVVFNYSDSEALGCSTQVVLKTPIVVFESPKADFSFAPDEITIANPEVTFINRSTTLKNNKYFWTIEGVAQMYDVNPVMNLNQVGDYKVTLVATTKDGCRDEMTKIVEVKNEFNVFIPNSFTPNYDGLNDVFLPVFSPYGLDGKTYSLEIFDKWGRQIFSSADYTKAWDGTVQNKGDQPLKADVYVYKLKYKDLNGQIYTKIGDITLLR